MKFPKPLGLPALTVGLLLTASTALAQEVAFGDIDTNADSKLDAGELEAALGSTSLLSFDQDGDGALSEDELRDAVDTGDDGSQDDDGATDDGDDGVVDDSEDDGSDDGETIGDDNGSQDDGDDGVTDGDDDDRGHGNDEDGFDDDNPGRGHGDDGVPGGGRHDDNPGRGHGNKNG